MNHNQLINEWSSETKIYNSNEQLQAFVAIVESHSEQL
jgi:hypothetical protein